jgi:hypothetical protein
MIIAIHKHQRNRKMTPGSWESVEEERYRAQESWLEVDF